MLFSYSFNIIIKKKRLKNSRRESRPKVHYTRRAGGDKGREKNDDEKEEEGNVQEIIGWLPLTCLLKGLLNLFNIIIKNYTFELVMAVLLFKNIFFCGWLNLNLLDDQGACYSSPRKAG